MREIREKQLKTEVVEIPIELIDIVQNVRDEPTIESVSGLRESMKKRGVLQAVRVRREGERFPLVSGHRRVLAARQEGLGTIPAIIVSQELDEPEIVLEQLTENLQREDLSDLEKARGIELLMDAKSWTAAQVAGELGLSESQVCNWRSLLELPKAVQDIVGRGDIAVSTAVEIARAGDAETQIRLADEAVKEGLTRDAVAGRVKAQKRGAATSAVKSTTRATLALAADRSVRISAAGLTLDSAIAYLEELLAKARKARVQGVTLNTFCRLLKEQAKS